VQLARQRPDADLDADARQPLSALARHVGLSAPSVAERLRRLQEARMRTGRVIGASRLRHGGRSAARAFDPPWMRSLDPRQPLSALARHVGLSAPSVAERLRRLQEAGVVRGVTAEDSRGRAGRSPR
jgi:DNA-binding Lrp family transcriptional regulator